MPSFICRDCGSSFALPEQVLARYPGWQPRQCRSCRNAAKSRSKGTGQGGSNGEASPSTGVFTDGGASPNPGPGGWGAVYVVDDEVVEERHGHDPDTTNNRMELTALIEAAEMAPEGERLTVYSDSNLAVRTINEWAAGWEKRGWKRKTGPVENLDLVRRAYRLYRNRPELEVAWVKAHAGNRWNEYADELANRWRTR